MTQQPFGTGPEYATLTADDLVTGEAVALDLPPAGLAIRVVSGFLDVLVTVVLLFVALFVLTVATITTDEALLWVAYIGSLVIVFLVVPTTLETLTRGRSLGHLATGLRTVRDDGGPITAQHALTRALIGVVEIYAFTGIPAVLSSMLSHKGKRLGDYAAGTYVVRDRVRLVLPPPVWMPRQLAAWASAADISSLPVGLALGVRQYLGRADQITPQSRAVIGAQLAAQVGEYVAPPPPPGTSHEDFLAAVVASRRERDSARLHREEALRRRLTARR
ncbi:RDD family protein [Nocardioides sp.]|uniref:RDD family protein n=1 Tax=Nocardioides sp. TaxID=35761 RepID=UPI003D123EED